MIGTRDENPAQDALAESQLWASHLWKGGKPPFQFLLGRCAIIGMQIMFGAAGQPDSCCHVVRLRLVLTTFPAFPCREILVPVASETPQRDL